MSWYSVYGSGATIHGIERTPDGRVTFTVWLSVFWIPLIPISSWSAVYAAEPSEVTPDETHYFVDLMRIPHTGSRLARTFVGGVLVVVAAVAPIAVMIDRTTGRAGTTVEFFIMLGFIFWAVGLIIFLENNRRKKLRGG